MIPRVETTIGRFHLANNLRRDRHSDQLANSRGSTNGPLKDHCVLLNGQIKFETLTGSLLTATLSTRKPVEHKVVSVLGAMIFAKNVVFSNGFTPSRLAGLLSSFVKRNVS